MAIEKKRMRQRRGPYSDFDPLELLPHEIAIVISGDPNTSDGKSAYICIQAGEVKRIIFEDEFDTQTMNVVEKVIEQLDDEIQKARNAANYANSKGLEASNQAQEAKLAADNANAVADDLIKRRDAGEFTGPQGPQGIPGQDGKDGANGVVVTIAGQFAMQIQNGHLHVIYPDGGVAPNMEIGSDGHLLWSY